MFLPTDLEARERQAEAQSQEEVQITRTLEEEVRELMETMWDKIFHLTSPRDKSKKKKKNSTILQLSTAHWKQGVPVHPGNSEARPGAFILAFIKDFPLIELKSLGREQRLYLREAFFTAIS